MAAANGSLRSCSAIVIDRCTTAPLTAMRFATKGLSSDFAIAKKDPLQPLLCTTNQIYMAYARRLHQPYGSPCGSRIDLLKSASFMNSGTVMP